MSRQSTLAYLFSVKWEGHKPGLSRTRELLAFLGNPERTLRFVHIAGTNGKGSTAAMTASCLTAAGLRTGLFTSPFLNFFNERIQVDGVPIADGDLEAVVDAIRPQAEKMTDSPTEFEMITAAGFLYFAQRHCDVVVLEVGLGGLLDSTNVIDTPEVAVITALGLDHTRELGPTLTDIARAKAGIIKPGGDVVCYPGTQETDDVLAKACAAQNARLTKADFSSLRVTHRDLDGVTFDFGPLTGLRLPLLALYQPRNAAVALTALQILADRGWPISEAALRQGLETVSWPGRFELLSKDPVFVLDGSHNPQGMAATAESLRAVFPQTKFTFLLSVMADKDADAMLQILCPLAKNFVTVTAATPRALPARELAGRIASLGFPAVPCESISAGVDKVLAQGGPVCALGTLYFSGDVRRAYTARKAKR